MNEQALQDAYQLFKEGGYNGSIEDFTALINENPDALNDSYDLFSNSGYNGSIEDYSTLIGVKKKDSSVSIVEEEPVVSELGDGSSDSFQEVETETIIEPEVKTDTSPALNPLDEEDEFSQSLTVIDNNLIADTEKNVVAEMNYHFGDYGFEFSERGLGDAMMVTSSVKDENGKYKKIKIDLDPDISLLGFSLIGRGKKKSKEAEKLRQFIKENKKQEDKNVINETEEQYKINKEKFLNKQEITEKLNIFNNESTIFKNQINGFLEKRSDFENRKKEIDTWSQEKINANRQEWEDFQEEKKMLDEEYASLLKTEEDFQTRGFYLDSMVGEYTAKESEKGTWAGGIFNSFTRGIGRIAAGGMSLAIDALASIPGIQEPNDSKFIAHAIDKGFITLEKIEQINNSILPTSSTVNIEGTEVIGKRTPEEIDEEEKIRNNKLLNAIKESLSKEQVSSINSLIKDLNKKSLKYNNVEEVDILDSEGNPTGLKVDKVVDTTNPYAQSAKKFLDEDNVGMLKASRDGTTIVFGTDNTTAEWTDLKKQGFWGGAILGLGESIPAMIGGGGIAGWANRTAKMYAQVSDHVMETMEKDSDFDNITENEKLLFTIPLGSVVAGLEAFGLRNIINQKGLLNGILLKAINKTPKGKLAGLTFNQALQREVKSTGLKFMGGAGAAALAEFETGFAQEGADIGFKKLYNAMKEKEMFSTPEGGLDILKQMIRAGGQEAVGGFILGVPNGIQVAFNKYDFTTLEKGQWEMFKEINKTEKSKSQYFSFFVQDIKNKILTKKITKQQGEQILNDFNKVSSLYSQVPTDLSNTQQQQILGLLSRKQDLEQQIQGKDKALVAEQIEEIADINVRMAEVLRAKIETEDEETIEQRLENRDKSLFEDTQEAGGRTSTISDITTKDGVSTGIYSDQDGNADIVISSTGDNQNFVGYYRVYENGKPTNKWTSKMQISDSKQFSNMIEDAQSKLPEGHTWTETTSVSKDGLRVWNKAKEKGYVEVTDADGNVVTTTVTLNQAQKKTDGSKPSYKDVIVRSKEKANAIIKELQKIYPNIKVTKVGPKIKIELPVLQKKSTETLTQEEADIDTFFGENIENNNIDNVSNNLVVNGKDTLSKFQEKIISLAKLSLKAISKIAPDIRMVIHTNEKNYNKSAKQNTNGEYNPNTKIIHINLGRIGSQISKAEKSKDLNQLNSLKAKALTTVPHEIFHAIVVSKTETDLETSKLTKALMSSIRKSLLSNQKTLLKDLENFSSQYDESLQSEEQLAQLMGILSSNFKVLTKPQKNIVLQWVKTIGQKLGLSLDFINQLTKDEEAVVDLINVLSKKVSTGEVITEEDIEVIEKIKKRSKKDLSKVPPKELTAEEYIDRQTRQQKDEVAAEAFNLDELEVISKGGSGRIVYQHPDVNKVIKVATSPRGLEQNLSMGFGDFNILDGQVAELFEQGLDYIVTEKVPRNDKVVNKFLKPLKKFSAMDFKDGRSRELIELLENMGLSDFRNYNLLWGDFIVGRNWGVRKNGEIVLVDEGALNDKVYYGSKIEEWAQEEWQDVKSKRRKARNQLDLFEEQEVSPEGEFNPSSFYEAKIKEFQGDTLRAAYATQEEVRRREQPKPKRTPAKKIKTIQDFFESVTHNDGFINKINTVASIQNMLPSGYTAIRSEETYDGYGGDIYISKSNSTRKINPKTSKRKIRSQQDMIVPDSGGRKILDYFVEGLENNFTRDAITSYLVRRKGIKMRDIKKSLELVPKSDTKLVKALKMLPKSFSNVKGGMKKGIKLFNKVMLYRQNLINKNKDGRVKRKLSQAEINQKTVEFLESQVEYKNESPTRNLSAQQALMQVDLIKQLDARPRKEIGAKLRTLRFMLQNVNLGRRSLEQIKREVRNFIRVAMPQALYSKPEVLKLINKLNAANPTNITEIISEIADLAVVKNVKILSQELNDLLNGKYEVNIGGRKRGYKVDLRAKEILKQIKKSYKDSFNMTAEQINEQNAVRQKNYDELAKKANLTDIEIDKMASFQIMIELNNSLLMLDNNVHKLTSLSSAVEQLMDVIMGGKKRLNDSIRAQHKEYRRQFSTSWFDITGVELPIQQLEQAEKDYEESPTEKNKTKLKETQELYDKTIKDSEGEINDKNDAKAVEGRVKRLMKGILNSVRLVFESSEALDGLMAKISSLPGRMFEGKMQELVTEKIDAASRLFKGRKLEIESIMRDKMKEIFGKKWKVVMAKNRNIKRTGIYRDQSAVLKAEGNYKKNPTKENLILLNKIKAKQELLLSQEQMYYYYNQYKDPALEKTFENMYGSEYKRIMQEMTDALSPETKAWADYQVDVLFPMLYEHYNKTYQKIYRTNMPYNEKYAGKIYRDGIIPEALDLLGGNVTKNSVTSSSTLARTQNTNNITKMNGTDVLLTYINDMEYFAAFAVPVRDIDKIFTNPLISNAIEKIHGKSTNFLIKNAIEKIANKGVRTDASNIAISHMNDAFILSRLGLNPVVMLKQLTSFITYAADIGFANYFYYGMKNLPQVIKTWKEIRDNSIYMKDRKNDGIMKAIESYTESSMQEFVPTWFGSETIGSKKEFLTNFLMFTTKFGDRTAIMMGGMPNYIYYKADFKKKNPKATEQEAIDYAIIKFERDTKRTQQSGDLQDKDIFQTANPLVRAMNMFMTTPKQYLRKEIIAFRELGRKAMAMDRKAGKGTLGDNLRVLGMFHVVMPVFFQYVALGLPGVLRGVGDDDKKDLTRAAILGNLNALFIIGEVFNYAGDFFTGKPWAGDNVKSLGILNIAGRLTTMAKRAEAAKSPEKRNELYMRFYLELSTITGMPAPQVKKIWDNYSALYTDSMPPGEAILRLFNFSKYQIDAGKKEKKKTKPLTKRELQQYFPDLYELKYGNISELEIEKKELESQRKEEEKLIREEILNNMFN